MQSAHSRPSEAEPQTSAAEEKPEDGKESKEKEVVTSNEDGEEGGGENVISGNTSGKDRGGSSSGLGALAVLYLFFVLVLGAIALVFYRGEA
jgi:hypothetical protein